MASNNKLSQFPSQEKTGGSTLKVIGLVIVGLAVVGLIFSSVFVNAGGRDRGNFGRYGNRDIVYDPSNSFGQAVQNEMAKYQNNISQNNDFFAIARFMAWQQAFNTVLTTTAIAYHLDESGYEPSPRAVDRRIVEFGPFRTGGAFDAKKYREASAAYKASIREQFREQIHIETWSQDVLDSQYRSEAQLDFLQDMRSTVRSYDYVVIPFSAYPDEDVLGYARDNPELFRRIPVSRITMEIREEMDQVIALYDERQENIDAFASLAEEYSEDSYKDEGGRMDATEYHKLTELVSEEEADQIFAMEEGDVAGPFETDYGWILFHIDGAVDQALEDERVEDFRSYMLQNEIGVIEDAVLAMVGDLRDRIVGGESFQDVSETEGYEVKTTSAFPLNYGTDSLLGGGPENAGDPDLSGTSTSEEFWGGIVSLRETGDLSQPLVLTDAVALFSLADSEDLDALPQWESNVNYEFARSRQLDFQTAVLNEDSKLFTNDFSAAYSSFFPVQNQSSE